MSAWKLSRAVVFGIWALYVAAVVLWLLFPIGMVLFASFQGRGAMTGNFGPPNLEAYREIPWRYWESLRFTVIASLAATVCALLASVPAAWAVVRGRLRERRVLSNLVLLPDIVPHIILGIALLSVYLRLGLNNSFFGILFALLALSLAMGLRFSEAIIEGLPEEYEHAAETMGASKLTVMRRIVIPLMAPGLATAALFIFMHNMVAFEILFFIAGPSASPIAVRLFGDIVDRGILPFSVAMSAIMVYLAIAFYIVVALTLGPRYLLGTAISRKG